MKEKVYKGSSKTLYQAPEDFALIMSFEDTMRISNDVVIEASGKGAINNSVSSYIMQKLEMIGIEHHFIEKINMKRQLIQFVDIYPVQLHVSTVACGRYVTEFGMEDGFVFDSPLLDFRVKNKDLNYPAINESQIVNFEWMSKYELKEIKNNAMRIHDFVNGLFAGVGIRMVDIKLEFGRVFNGEEFVTMLADEISPDTCRLWDMETNEPLCFEAASEGSEKLIDAYQKVLKRFDIKT